MSWSTTLPSGRPAAPGQLQIHTSRHCNNKEVPSQEFSRVNYYNSSCRGLGTWPHLRKKQQFTPYLILRWWKTEDGKFSSSVHVLAFFPEHSVYVPLRKSISKYQHSLICAVKNCLHFNSKGCSWWSWPLTEFKGLPHSSLQLRGVLRSLLVHFRPQMM